MDFVSKEKRSAIMRGAKSKNTKPELAVRSFLHNAGFRFRLHRKDLPGKPDIVLPKYKVAIFVHGCFWHQHRGCKDGRVPDSNTEYWLAKFARNAERDKRHMNELRKAGWRPLVIWECQAWKENALSALIVKIANAGQ